MTQCVDRTTKRFTMRVERQVLRQVWTDDRRTLEVRLIVKNRQSYTNKVVVAFVSPTIPDGQLRLVNYAAIARFYSCSARIQYQKWVNTTDSMANISRWTATRKQLTTKFISKKTKTYRKLQSKTSYFHQSDKHSLETTKST